MEEKPNNVNTFLAAYYDAAVASGIAKKTAECYVNWAQKFTISIKGKLRCKTALSPGKWIRLERHLFSCTGISSSSSPLLENY